MKFLLKWPSPPPPYDLSNYFSIFTLCFIFWILEKAVSNCLSSHFHCINYFSTYWGCYSVKTALLTVHNLTVKWVDSFDLSAAFDEEFGILLHCLKCWFYLTCLALLSAFCTYCDYCLHLHTQCVPSKAFNFDSHSFWHWSSTLFCAEHTPLFALHVTSLSSILWWSLKWKWWAWLTTGFSGLWANCEPPQSLVNIPGSLVINW